MLFWQSANVCFRICNFCSLQFHICHSSPLAELCYVKYGFLSTKVGNPCSCPLLGFQSNMYRIAMIKFLHYFLQTFMEMLLEIIYPTIMQCYVGWENFLSWLTSTLYYPTCYSFWAGSARMYLIVLFYCSLNLMWKIWRMFFCRKSFCTWNGSPSIERSSFGK